MHFLLILSKIRRFLCVNMGKKQYFCSRYEKFTNCNQKPIIG